MLQKEQIPQSGLGLANSINANACYRVALKAIERFPQRLPPPWLPLSAMTKLFDGEKLIKTFTTPTCALCGIDIESLALRLFHYFFLHSDHVVVVAVAHVSNRDIACISVIGNCPFRHCFRALIFPQGPSFDWDSRVQWLGIILERMVFACPPESSRVVSFFQNERPLYTPDEYEYWLFRSPHRKENQLKAHLKKTANLVAGKRTQRFIECWNFFVLDFKNRLLDSNFFFTNFLNCQRESFILCWIFLEDYSELVAHYQQELKLHVFLLFTHCLVTEDELRDLITRIDGISEL